MEQLLEQIAKADAAALEEIRKAMLKRYAQLFPDWEVIILSLEKETDADQQIDRIIEVLKSGKRAAGKRFEAPGSGMYG